MLGTFADGSVQDLTGSSQLSFSSSATPVASASATGVITAAAPGDASIFVTYARSASAGVTVIVSPLNVTASPADLSFANTTVGQTSATQSVTVTNQSAASLTLSSVAISGDFSETDNCSGQAVASGGTCSITVKYAPTMIGQEGGQLTVSNSVDLLPLTVPLSGAEFRRHRQR